MEMGGEIKTTQLVFFFSFQIGDKETKGEISDPVEAIRLPSPCHLYAECIYFTYMNTHKS